MNEIWLIAPVILPLIGGFLVGVLRLKSRRLNNIVTEAIVVINAIIVWLLVFNRPESTLHVYSFTNELSISFSLDGFGSFFALISSTLWAIVTIYAFEYMRKEPHQNRFFAFFVMTFGITQAICFADNLITLFVFYEMLTLVTIPLVINKFDHESMFAGRKYAVWSFGGSAFAFVGIVLLAVHGQGLDFTLGGTVSAFSNGDPIAIWSYLLMFFGFGVKACVFPLCGWLPTASVAPTPVTALLHAVAVVKTGLFAIIRTTYYCFGKDVLSNTPAQYIAMAFALITMLYGAGMAIRERHFKRRLAYSTISNLSYVLMGILLLTDEGFAAGLSHMMCHAVIKITAFLCAGAFMHMTGKSYIFELDGIGKKMPVTFICFTISALSLVGIPLFCGFTSKWQLSAAAVNSGSVMGVVTLCVLIATAFMCAIYMLSLCVRAFFPKEGRDIYKDATSVEAPLTMTVPLCILCALCIGFGIFGNNVVSLTTAIATGAW